MSLLSQQLPGLALGLFRIMFGILWLDAALQKAPWVINPQGQRFGWLSNWIWQEIQHPTFELYKKFLETVVLPNNTLNPFFGYMSFFVEMALGISLLLGVLTVLSGIGGALWQFNIALGSYSVPGEWYWIWPLLIAPHLVFAHSHAGRVVGLDGVLPLGLARSQCPSRQRYDVPLPARYCHYRWPRRGPCDWLGCRQSHRATHSQAPWTHRSWYSHP